MPDMVCAAVVVISTRREDTAICNARNVAEICRPGARSAAKCGTRLSGRTEEPAHASGSGGPELKGGGQEPRSTAGRGRGVERRIFAKAMAGPFLAAAILTVLGMIVATLAGPAGWAAVGIGALVVWGALAMVLLYRRLTVRYRLTTLPLLPRHGPAEPHRQSRRSDRHRRRHGPTRTDRTDVRRRHDRDPVERHIRSATDPAGHRAKRNKSPT